MFKYLKENPKALAFSAFQTSRVFATQIVVPFLSIILLEANWNNKEITYFFSAFVLAGFLFSPVIGKISDFIGRKKIILIGLIFQVIFMLTYFFVNSKTLIYFARFLDGIAFACIGIVTLSAFEDIIKEKRGFWTGLFLSIGTIGALTGPLLAGYIAENYFTKILLLLSIIFLFVSIIILILIPEKHKKNKHKIKLKDFNPLTEIKKFISHKELKGMAILGIIMNAKGQIYAIFFPILVITTLELPKSYLGFLITIPVFFHIFQFYYGRIADAISARFGTILGVSIVASSIFFLPYVKNLTSLIILLTLYGIGGGIWNVNAWTLMGNIAKKHNIEGEIVGTYMSIAKIGVFFATLGSAYIIDIIGISRTLQIFAIFVLIATCISYFYFQPIFHTSKKNHMFHDFFKHEENKKAVLIKAKK